MTDRHILLQLPTLRHGPLSMERQEFARGLIDVAPVPRHRFFHRLDGDGVVMKCSGRQLCDGQIAQGSTAFLPAGLPTNWRVGYRFACLTVGVEAEAFAQFAFEHTAGDVSQPLESPPRLDTAFNHLIDMLTLEAACSDRVAATTLDALYGMLRLHLLRRYANATHAYEDQQIKQRLEAYIEQHMGEQILVEAMAEVVGMSANQLSRWMQKQLGTLPKRFLSDIRLNHARTLLENTTQSLLDIALSTGFGTHAHFSTSFRERFGATPSQYRSDRGVGSVAENLKAI